MATEQDMKITRGDTKKFYVLVVDELDAIFDLTGYDMVFTARASLSSVTPAITSTATITAAAGRGDFKILPSETDIPEGEYRYDVQISSGTDDKYTVVENQKLTIGPGLTQT